MLNFSSNLNINSFPETLPIFDGAEALLLPGGQLPLHIFEPKYVNLVEDALAAKNRLVGVCLKNKVLGGIYKTGCAGRITSFDEMADGRLLIALTGFCRFKVIEEIPSMRGHKRLKVDWEEFESDVSVILNPEIDRDKLIKKIKSYSEGLAIDMDWEVLEQTPSFNIITFFAMNLPFSVDEKQMLLESLTLEDRADNLIELIDKKKAESV